MEPHAYDPLTLSDVCSIEARPRRLRRRALLHGNWHLIEVEVQNETYQTQEVVRFTVVPRIGEGIQLPDGAGFSVSFDVVDVWYQKSAYGDVWVPYVHVRETPKGVPPSAPPLWNGNSAASAP